MRTTYWNFFDALSVLYNERNKQAGNAIMTTNKSIKIIKRGERAAQEAEVSSSSSTHSEEKKSARDVVATVTEWVNEFQQKRRTETTQALKTLFGETTPQPTKA
jgi:glycyl-tRNA synthetase beta subunit